MRTRLLTIVYAASLFTRTGLAQTGDRAELAGHVKDENGGALAGVSLQLKNPATGHEYKVLSEDTGEFVFPFVAPGTYILSAELPGFARYKVEGIRLTLNRRIDLQCVMKVGGPETIITVGAEPNEIDTTSATIKDSIGEKVLKDLPILTRIQGRGTLTTVPLLFAGVTAYGYGIPSEQADMYGIGLTINGSPVGGVGYYFDGIDNTYLMPYTGGSATTGPNPDALAEMAVLAQNYKAEAGGHQAQIHWGTKAGGNRFHGQARALHLNPDLSARDFFDSSRKSEWTTSGVGFQLSGPMILPYLYSGRDKSAFMVDFESTRSRFEWPTRDVLLSDAERNGDFSSLPTSSWPKDPATGTPFPEGKIPANRILPQARHYMDKFIPRVPHGNEIVGVFVETPSRTQFTGRFDHQFSAMDTLNLSSFYSDAANDQSFTSTLGSVGRLPENGFNLAFHHTHNLSTRAANSFTFGSTYWSSSIANITSQHEDITRYGFNITRDTEGPTGFPTVQTDSTRFDPNGWQILDKVSTFHWKDDFAWNRGANAIKFGGEIRHTGTNPFNSRVSAPSFIFSRFTPSGTGNDIANFLLGIPNSYSQQSDRISYLRRLLTSLYIQDDFRLRSNLTINLGLRYELNGVISEREGHTAAFRPGATSSIFPKAPQGVIFVGDLDPMTGRPLGRGLNPSDKDNFAPRLGVSYSPSSAGGLPGRLFGGPGQTSIRTGYGLFYILGRANATQSLAVLPPWFLSTARDAARLQGSGGNFADPWGSDPDPFLIPSADRGFILPLGGVPFVDSRFREPYEHQWSFSIQRQLPKQFTLEVAYVGNRAVHLMRTFQANPGLVTPGANPFNVNSRRMDSNFGGVTGYVADGESVYHGLQTTVARRFASRLNLNAHYVWSKTLDDAGGGDFAIADRDSTSWARANWDRTHNFVFYGVWELPGLRGLRVVDKILSGWQASGIVQLQSGRPLLIRNAFDNTLRGIPAGFPDITGPFRKLNPREILTFRLPSGQQVTGNFLFDPTVFQTVVPNTPEQARPGSLGRNAFTGSGNGNFDFSLLKRINLTEQQRLDLRVDVTNALNHTQFRQTAAFNYTTDSAMFGRVTATRGPRRIQLYLRYSF